MSYRETIDLDDVGIEFGGMFAIGFQTATADCEYDTDENGLAVLTAVTGLRFTLRGEDQPDIVLDVLKLPQEQQDTILEAVRTEFDAWMDGAGDVSPADHDPPPHDAATRTGMYDHDDIN